MTKDSIHRDNERAVTEIPTNFDMLTQREARCLISCWQAVATSRSPLATVKARRGHVMRKMKTQSLTELLRMVDRLRRALSKL